jgi:hypothetical protein
MDFHGNIDIPTNTGYDAFAALTSEDGARHFRDIRKYTAYSKVGNRVHVQYKTLWGTTSQDMTLGHRRITFRGSGPLGVTFGGSWTHLSDSIVLEQTVWGLPRCMRGVVQKRVNRALEDLRQVIG